ncbi:unnamed protein product, partial [Closterium sp. NIES-54]
HHSIAWQLRRSRPAAPPSTAAAAAAAAASGGGGGSSGARGADEAIHERRLAVIHNTSVYHHSAYPSRTSFPRSFLPSNHGFERRRQFELPREKRRLVVVEAKNTKADAARERNLQSRRHDGWRGEGAKKRATASPSSSSASSPPKEVPADSSPPAAGTPPVDSSTSVPATTGSVTSAAPEPADTSVPDTVPADAPASETSLAAEPDASAAAGTDAAAASAQIASPEDVPPSEAALPRATASAAGEIENPLPAISAAAQEALSRAQRASSSAWQSLATAAAEPVALPKQLQESVQALPLPPSLKGRLGIADGSAVILTRGQLAAALLAVGLLAKGVQSWVKARATALNTESTLPAPLLPASPNLPTIPDLPPVVPTKFTAKDVPYLPVSSPPSQLPDKDLAPVPVPVMPSAYVATAFPSSAAAAAAAVAAASLPSAAVAPSSAAAAASAKEARAPLPAALIESEPPFETFTNPDNTGSREESREEKNSLLPPAFFKFTDSLPPLPFPFKNWGPFGKAPGASPIDMDEIDRMAAAAASKGDTSDSEIDDRPRLIKLQQ